MNFGQAAVMTPSDFPFSRAGIRGELRDPTLSFQLREGFEIVAVVGGYLRHDPESHGYAAVIEWLNAEHPDAVPGRRRDPRFRRPQAGEP